MPNDKQRLTRAMEVYYLSGKPISSFHNKNRIPQSEFNFLKIGLMPKDRNELHKKIKLRTEKMFEKGFLNEVKALVEKYPDLNKDHASMRSVGYRQIFNTLNQKIKIEELIEMIVIATRQLAKRQLTWMRSMNGLLLYDPVDKKKDALVINKIKKFLEN